MDMISGEGYEGSRQQFLNDANDEINKILYNFELSEDVRVYRIELDAVCVFDALWLCTPETACINSLKVRVYYRIIKPRPKPVDSSTCAELEYAIVDILNKLECATGVMVHSIDVPYNGDCDIKLWHDRTRRVERVGLV